MLNLAIQLIREINSFGYDAYIVGGAVRDHLMSKESYDVDIATNMPMSLLYKHWECHDIGKSKDFGIVVVVYNDVAFEVSQFRKDGEYSDGRRPDEVLFTSDIIEDLSRRDFTINSFAMDANGKIIDPFNGREDIKKRIIRSVGKPFDRISEDYLRMMRAVRFATRFDFEIEETLKSAISNNVHKLKFLAVERIADELVKMASLSGEHFANSIVLMKNLGILKCILPEVDMMDQFEHNPLYHPEGHCGKHTELAIRSYTGSDYRVNLALLFHDLGKTVTQTIEGDDIRYHGHEVESVRITEEILRRYKFPNDVIDTILFGVGNHMRACKIEEMRPGKIYKMAVHPDWPILQDVLYCDKVSRGERFDRVKFDKLMETYADTARRWKQRLIEKENHIVSGHYVMNLTGLKPGPAVGRILKEVTEWAIESDINDPKDIDRMIRYLSEKET